MSSDKRYFEHLTKEQLAAFLREMADGLAGEAPDSAAHESEHAMAAPDPGEFKKLKISIKRDLGGYTLKYKSKALIKQTVFQEEGAVTATDEGEIKYKKLKKRMKGAFKAITESLMADTMPGEAAVTSFLQDSKLMISFPEKGAEFYNDYDQACTTFARAFEAKNLEACKAAGIALNQLKKDCHSRYK